MRPTFARIYLSNFEHNLKYIRSRMKNGTKMCVAVKADAYGHGAVECAKRAVKCGAEYLAVACVSEGIELRDAGIPVPVLVLSLVNKDEISELLDYKLTPLVFDEEYIELIAEECKAKKIADYPVHLAVDTGMGRIGCYPENAGKIARFITDTGILKLEGMCTHFSVADSIKAENVEYTKKQFERFCSAVENVKKEGIDPGIKHCANSAVTLLNPDMHMDMCRPGIICYGYYPDEYTKKYFESKGDKEFLKPVMALFSKVAVIRDFKKGESVSYGRTWTAKNDTKMAVLPVGYGDGVFRRFNSSDKNGEGDLKVSIKSKAFPVRGRICMDQLMVEIGKSDDIERWDEAVIFGPEETGAVYSAQDIADLTKTISYEITCGISKRVPRIYVD